MSSQSLFHETDLATHGIRSSLGLGLRARFAAWRRRRREMNELARMTAHDLADIGLTRSDLPAIAAGELMSHDWPRARL